MTTDPLKQLMDSLQGVRLASDERLAMRRTLLSMTHANPVRPPVSAFFARHVFSSLFVAFLCLVGGTTALAERSLPNDFLYPLKTHLNDRVAVAVAGDEDRKIQKELEQVSYALNEEDVVADQELRADADTEQEVPSEPTPIEFHDDAEADLRNIEIEIDASLTSTPEFIE